jgi:hypothetical protein
MNAITSWSMADTTTDAASTWLQHAWLQHRIHTLHRRSWAEALDIKLSRIGGHTGNSMNNDAE